jgi:hypothetical protein
MHPTRNSAALIIYGSSGRVMPGVMRLSLLEVTANVADSTSVALKDRMKWFAVLSGCTFLAISSYIKYVRMVYYIGEEARFHMQLAILAALATLVFGLMSLPRWQSFFALAVFAYSFYYFSRPAYGIG